jgi:hypothetical protein
MVGEGVMGRGSRKADYYSEASLNRPRRRPRPRGGFSPGVPRCPRC